MAWLFVPGSEASSSASTSPSASGTAPFVTSSGKPTPRPLSWHGWRTRPWIRLLCGTTSSPLTAARGVERWTSSLRDSRVNRGASQESAQAPPTIDGSGPTSPASSPRSSRRSSTSKTSQASFAMASPSCWRTLPGSGSMRSGTVFERATLGRRTGASGSSSSRTTPAVDLGWPTPTSHDSEGSGRSARAEASSRHGGKPHDLQVAVRLWPTPRANADTGPDICARQGGATLQTAAAALYPTPNARDWKGPDLSSRHGGASLSHFTETGERSHHSRQVPETPRRGPRSSDTGPTSRPRLNPEFVDWLMGWPPGWTACAPLETGLFRSWLATVSSLFAERLGLAVTR